MTNKWKRMKLLFDECIRTHSPKFLKLKKKIDMIRLCNNTKREKYKMKETNRKEKKKTLYSKKGQ